MMNYSYVTHSDNGDLSHVAASVKENNTDSWIAVNIPLIEAKKLVRHLNLGGGFDGFTPAFFLNKISPTGA